MVVGISFRRANARFSEVYPLSPVNGRILTGVVLTAVGVNIIISDLGNSARAFLPSHFGILPLLPPVVEGEEDLWRRLWRLALCSPVIEEFLFRGLILRGFLLNYSKKTAIILSALIFGFIHLHLSVAQVVVGVGLGVLYGIWYVRTGSLVPGLVGHALQNGLISIAKLLPFKISGYSTGGPPAVQFQPWWFDLLGLILVMVGFWVFLRATHQSCVRSLPDQGSVSG